MKAVALLLIHSIIRNVTPNSDLWFANENDFVSVLINKNYTFSEPVFINFSEDVRNITIKKPIRAFDNFSFYGENLTIFMNITGTQIAFIFEGCEGVIFRGIQLSLNANTRSDMLIVFFITKNKFCNFSNTRIFKEGNGSYQFILGEDFYSLFLHDIAFYGKENSRWLPIIKLNRVYEFYLDDVIFDVQILECHKVTGLVSFISAFSIEKLDMRRLSLNNFFVDSLEKNYLFHFERTKKLNFREFSVINVTINKGFRYAALFLISSESLGLFIFANVTIMNSFFSDYSVFMLELEGYVIDISNFQIFRVTNATLFMTITSRSSSLLTFNNTFLIDCLSLRLFSFFKRGLYALSLKISYILIYRLGGSFQAPIIMCQECDAVFISSLIVSRSNIEFLDFEGGYFSAGILLKIINSAFIFNTIRSGQASYFLVHKKSSIFIEENYFFANNFQDNTTLIIAKDFEYILISASIVVKNKAEGFPYLARLYGSEITLMECLFIENESLRKSGMEIFGMAANIFINKVILAKNRANNYVFFYFKRKLENSIINYSFIYMKRLIISKNQGSKGLIYVGDNPGLLFKVEISIFYHNFASLITVFDGKPDSNELKFYQNDCICVKNQAYRASFFNVLIYYGIVFLVNNIFSENVSELRGGVVYAFSILPEIYSRNSFFFANEAQQGAVFFINGAYVTDISSVYLQNIAESSTSLYASDDSKIYFCNIIIDNSVASTLGNLVITSRASLFIYGTKFFNSKSNSNSGVIRAIAFGRVEVSNCLFLNISGGEGTIFNALSVKFVLLIKGCIFQGNKSPKSLIFLESSKLIILETVFENNIGALFYLKNKASFELIKVMITNTSCHTKSACFLNSLSNSIILFKNVVIEVLPFEQVELFISCSNTTFKVTQSFFRSSIITHKPRNNYSLLMPYLFNMKNSYLLVENANIENFPIGLFYLEETKLDFKFNKITSVVIKLNKFRGVFTALHSDLTVYTSLFHDILVPVFHLIGDSKLAEVPHIILISFCIITNISAGIGSSLIIVNTNLLMKFTLFYKNKADMKGGCAKLICNQDYTSTDKKNSDYKTSSNVCLWTFLFNFFIENSAELAGGAIYWEDTPPLILPPVINFFSGNVAGYGNELASSPLFIDTDGISVDFNAYVSGSIFKNRIIFRVSDFYSQKAVDNKNTDTAKISIENIDSEVNTYLGYNNSQKILKGKLTSFVENGNFYFENIILIGIPTDKARLLIEVTAIPFNNRKLMPSAFMTSQKNSEKHYFCINITFAPCKPGEVFLSEKLICYRCQENSYAFEPNLPDEICGACPKFAKCLGGDRIITNEGYWRSSLNSINIYKCKSLYSCIGGLNSLCSEGFEGRLCHKCIADGEKVK